MSKEKSSSALEDLSGSPRGQPAAEKALQLDDYLPEASLAYAKQNYEWDLAGAEKEFKRALDLNPNYSTAHQWYVAFLTMRSISAQAYAHAGPTAMFLKEIELLRSAQGAPDLPAASPPDRYLLAQDNARAGDKDQALSALREASEYVDSRCSS